jgi:SH3-like domain-containing protein
MSRILLPLMLVTVAFGCGSSDPKAPPPKDGSGSKSKTTLPIKVPETRPEATSAETTDTYSDPLIPLSSTETSEAEVASEPATTSPEPDSFSAHAAEPVDEPTAEPEVKLASIAAADGQVTPLGAEAGGDAVAPGGETVDIDMIFPEPRVGVVQATKLNLRAGPNIEKDILVTVKKGTNLTVIGARGDWLKVELPSTVNLWIHSKFVDIPEDVLMPAAGTVNANKVRLRAAGSLKATTLKHLDVDTQVEVVARVNDWLKVKAPAGTPAWAHGKYVKYDTTGSIKVARTDDTTAPVGGTDTTGKVNLIPVTGGETGDGTKTTPTGGETDPVGPKALSFPGVEVFAQAEQAYRQALEKQDPDWVTVFLLYHKVSSGKQTPADVRATCHARMKEIAAKLPKAEQKKIDDEVNRQLKSRLAALKREADEAKKLIPHVAPIFTAVGFIDKAPNLPGIPGTHKLSVSGVLIYYLQPTGKHVNLDRLIGRKVGVVGRKKFVADWGIQVIDVTEVQKFQEPPVTRARLEIPEAAAE